MLTDANVFLGHHVSVHRNLRDKCLSVTVRGLVVGHVDSICLADAVFRVRKGGQRRARRTRQRNVHAFVVGTVVNHLEPGGRRLGYNVYEDDEFVDVDTREHVHQADIVYIGPRGLWAQDKETG